MVKVRGGAVQLRRRFFTQYFYKTYWQSALSRFFFRNFYMNNESYSDSFDFCNYINFQDIFVPTSRA